MGDGWETARRRGPGHDWAIFEFGCPGTIRRVEIDTAHFKGNFPDRCALHAALNPDLAVNPEAQAPLPSEWIQLIGPKAMQADHQHIFELPKSESAIYSHVKLEMFPDGGVSRLRVLGQARPKNTADPSP